MVKCFFFSLLKIVRHFWQYHLCDTARNNSNHFNLKRKPNFEIEVTVKWLSDTYIVNGSIDAEQIHECNGWILAQKFCENEIRTKLIAICCCLSIYSAVAAATVAVDFPTEMHSSWIIATNFAKCLSGCRYCFAYLCVSLASPPPLCSLCACVPARFSIRPSTISEYIHRCSEFAIALFAFKQSKLIHFSHPINASLYISFKTIFLRFN